MYLDILPALVGAVAAIAAQIFFDPVPAPSDDEAAEFHMMDDSTETKVPDQD